MAKMEDLPVCKRCGWHDGLTHKNECNPFAGAAADQLIKAVGVPATKLGYGYGKVTFTFTPDKSITFGVGGDGSFWLEHLHWLETDSIDQNHARALVLALHNVQQVFSPLPPQGKAA